MEARGSISRPFSLRERPLEGFLPPPSGTVLPASPVARWAPSRTRRGLRHRPDAVSRVCVVALPQAPRPRARERQVGTQALFWPLNTSQYCARTASRIPGDYNIVLLELPTAFYRSGCTGMESDGLLSLALATAGSLPLFRCSTSCPSLRGSSTARTTSNPLNPPPSHYMSSHTIADRLRLLMVWRCVQQRTRRSQNSYRRSSMCADWLPAQRPRSRPIPMLWKESITATRSPPPPIFYQRLPPISRLLAGRGRGHHPLQVR